MGKKLDMELVLSYVLLSGVLLSAFLILVGTIWNALQPLPFPPGMLGVLREGFRFRGYDIMVLGFFALFATPVLRVLFALFLFLWGRDYKFALLSLLVLAIIAISLSSGKVR